MKEESIGKPTQYLGGKLREVTLENGASAWSFSSTQYVQAAVNNVEEYLMKKGEKLKAKAKEAAQEAKKKLLEGKLPSGLRGLLPGGGK